MEETIFFNLGNAIAASKDEKELIRMAQIEYDRRKGKEKLVIVEDPDTGELLLFDFSDSKDDMHQGKAFNVTKVIYEK